MNEQPDIRAEEHEVLVAINVVAYSEEEAIATVKASLSKEIKRDSTMTSFDIIEVDF